MRVKLPLSPEVLSATKSIQTRSFVVGADDAAWLTVNNRAFAQHPEQGGWTTEVLRSRQSEKWFDPNGFLLHHIKTNATDQLAGFCWTKIDKDTDPSVGEIYVIAVDPQFHGQGLGRALTVAGLNHLAKANATTGMLFVDRDNDAAVMTYTKLGFTIHDIEQAFVGEIPSHI
jgi:mycothiol synthase